RGLALGHASPEVERSTRWLDGTADSLEHLEREIAPLAIHGTERGSVRGKSRETPRRRELDRLRRAGIDVRLEPDEHVDEGCVTHRESDSPSGHVERLRERVELDRVVARGRHLEDRDRRLIVVELGVRRVARDDEPATLGPRYELFV